MKAQKVVDEIQSAGGDAIAVSGDVNADDFPEKILKATKECVVNFGGHSCKLISLLGNMESLIISSIMVRLILN